MDEARRFLRYVMPGLVYGVETTLWLFIVFPEWTYCLILGLAAKDGLGVAIGSVLASGALGYIFATAHHWCHWHLCIDEGILDHSELIKRLGLLPNESNKTKKAYRKKALEISLTHWYRLRDSNSIGDATLKKLDSLGDQAHAFGNARIASVFSVLTALAFCFKIGTFSLTCESVARFTLMLVLGISITYLFHYAYRQVGTIAQAIYDSIFEDAYAKGEK